MKAIILLTTNPGFQKKSYTAVKNLAKDSRVITTTHAFGRFDGVITCDCPDLQELNELTEVLRKDGVFHTETLIAIE